MVEHIRCSCRQAYLPALQQPNSCPVRCASFIFALPISSIKLAVLTVEVFTPNRFPAFSHPADSNSTLPLMSRSDGGSNVAVGLDPENLRERARFYADRNQIESAVFFAGNWNVMSSFDISF